jgi:hypothetical protein
VEANSTGGQGSHRAVAPSDDNDDYCLIIKMDLTRFSQTLLNSYQSTRRDIPECISFHNHFSS